jgi:alkylhydroperoxidase family enzyme
VSPCYHRCTRRTAAGPLAASLPGFAVLDCDVPVESAAAIAALLGHNKMETTLIYARIASRVAADEYAAASARSTPSTASGPNCPPTTGPPGMARVRREAHMLGNGLCTRPAELDSRMEIACETCAYFHSSTQSQPVLTRQRDHAREHGQSERAELSSKIIQKRAASPWTTITRITPGRDRCLYHLDGCGADSPNRRAAVGYGGQQAFWRARDRIPAWLWKRFLAGKSLLRPAQSRLHTAIASQAVTEPGTYRCRSRAAVGFAARRSGLSGGEA